MPVAQASSPLHASPVRYVKGVGPARARLLAELGVETLEDACLLAPRRYEDRSRLLPIARLQAGETATVRGKVLARNLRRIRGGRTIVEITVGDDTGVLQALWFHQPYLARQVEPQQELVLYGRVEASARPQMIHPEMERIEKDADSTLDMGRIVPVYPLVSGLTQRWMRRFIAGVLERDLGSPEDPLPAPMRSRHGWPELDEAIRQLHFPSSMEAAARAHERLAFDELLLLQLSLAQRRARTAAEVKPQRYQTDGPVLTGLRRALPFSLTAAQQRVLDELLADISRPSPMYRLLQGDVGCGKTIVVIALMAAAVQSGWQVALMAPTELLAEQHARVVGRYLAPLGVSVGLLSQGVAAAERKRLAADAASGRLSVVIGTHALLQKSVQFKRLALVVIDEQHKFGVVQRAALARKAQKPDVLVLTATPIPRTLALSIYGDLSISTINELPPGRRPIDTVWVRESQRQDAYALIRNQLAQGRQAYIVYPLVNESAGELRAASQMARQLAEHVFSDFQVGLLHGQLKPKEKERRMQVFAAGQTRLLVSTVIVEVGLDVPNATVMVIEHPERFGMAQLHQLRGRIGRGEHAATCILISDAQEETVVARLTAFARTTDGFQLAEQDLAQRGPGHLLGRHQHGWFRFRVADLADDRKLLELARVEADALVAADAALAAPAFSALRGCLERFRRHSG